MHPMVGRLICILMGLGFIAATLAITVPSVKRGYFEGKHGKIFRRGDIEYNVHCGLMLLCLSAGAAFVGAGFVLSDEKMMGKGPR